MLEGVSSLASTGRLARDQVDEVTNAAVALLLPVVSEQLERRSRSTSAVAATNGEAAEL